MNDIAFEDGSPVLWEDFRMPSEDGVPPEELDAERKQEQEKLFKRLAAELLLEVLVNGATPEQAGQRAFVLAHAMGVRKCGTQRELADALGLSQARVSQVLNAVKSHYLGKH